MNKLFFFNPRNKFIQAHFQMLTILFLTTVILGYLFNWDRFVEGNGGTWILILRFFSRPFTNLFLKDFDPKQAKMLDFTFVFAGKQ
jgi:hypothetical protein